MKELKDIIQHIAPTLASALGGPFAGVANKFITDNLVGDNISSEKSPKETLSNLLDDPKKLQKIKDLDQEFMLEMQKLDIDVFSLEINDRMDSECKAKTNQRPQIIISTLFLVAYFLMLTAIFAVEASDTINMTKGENSLTGELQILFGVLTAGVGQVLSYWFGGVFGKNDSP